ncbi:hypothetical protein J3R83DRAFT_2443 [Lanmaoa asiatica]|nr:hypothetical protein J3R83DRAFT_2443 [Lanmaoa asiatica]
MTPSLLLAPSSHRTDPLNADYTKRNGVLPPPFSVITTAHPFGTRSGPSSTSTTTPTTDSESECDAFDASTRPTNHTLVASQWTGTPIRAIMPLPRRLKLCANGMQSDTTARSVNRCNVSITSTDVVGLTRSAAHFWDETDMDSGAEHEEEDDKEGDEGSGEDRDATVTSRCCSYESITAAEGLSAWSFEELRVECYAQSLVARGTKPPPVVRPALAIPPAFVPRLVLRS